MHAFYLLTLAAAAQRPVPAPAPNSHPGERIAFSRLTGDFWQIWTIRPDGGDETPWTTGDSNKRHPEWSPSGDFLVYTDGNGALFRVDAPGGAPARLIADQSPIAEPALSLDDHVAYLHVRKVPGYLAEVWTSRLDGTDIRLVTRPPLRQFQPRWSPDQKHLAVSQFDPKQQLFSITVMDPDGSNPRNVVAGKEWLIEPCWSPDGTQLAYALSHDDDHDLWLVDADGKTPVQLTQQPGLDVSPVFSPDGRELAFVSRRSGSMQLWKLAIRDHSVTPLTHGDAPCREPAWFAPRHTSGPALHSVSIAERRLDLQHAAPISVAFALDKPAEVALEVLDDERTLVRTIRSSAVLSAGEHALAWDGRGESGAPSPNGVYLARLVARDANGRTEWEPSRDTGGTELTLVASELDANAHCVRFTMSAPGWVRLRAGLTEGPMLATLLDWAPNAGGPTTVTYAGRLPEPWGDFWVREDRAAWAIGYAFPENAIVVEGGPAPLRSGRPTLHVRSERAIYSHALHAREICHDPAIAVSLEGSLTRDTDGRPVVRDELNLVIDAATPAERAEFEQSRFEVAIFVDDQFLMEDEDSVLPFHFKLDVRNYPPGVHAFLVNVDAYGNHGGASFVPFRIAEKGAR